MARMMDEVNEIIRVLQLTSYDEDEWDADNLTVMKKAIVSNSLIFRTWFFIPAENSFTLECN